MKGKGRGRRPGDAGRLRAIAGLLRAKVRESGWTLRAVSRELGWDEDRLSKVLAGRKQLRIEDVYGVLEVIGLPPAEFFATLHGPEGPKSLFDVPLPPRDPDEMLPGGVTRRELYALVDHAVDLELGFRPGGGGGGFPDLGGGEEGEEPPEDPEKE